MPSFDVVSQVDMQEVRNAVDQAAREIVNRYDFKGTDTKIAINRYTLEPGAFYPPLAAEFSLTFPARPQSFSAIKADYRLGSATS